VPGLTGKTALVTGASTRIGRADIVAFLASAGARSVIDASGAQWLGAAAG
jgi:NAD(P)-dependent dehydrogenase (short-subunit alcohol dehydrogenase family)